MKEYYEKNRDIIIEYNLNYYYTHKEKVRERQNNYFKKVYYPNKIKSKPIKHKPKREVIITQNVIVTF